MIGMGRRPRIHYPGAVYHAMARGVDGCSIYIDDVDRNRFLSSLHRIISESGASLLAYCLMGNHFHLALKVSRTPLSILMHRILPGYAITFNNRHDRTGHLFQRRHEAKLCMTDAYLAALIRYIHLNPVRAGLVSKPEDWPWSSCRSHRDAGLVPGEIPPLFDPWSDPSDPPVPILIRAPAEDILQLSHYAEGISARTQISVNELRSGTKRPNVVAARKLFVSEAVSGGHRMASISRWLGLTSSSLTRYMRENCANVNA
jgi:REP element-mobilizing transposase RayT